MDLYWWGIAWVLVTCIAACRGQTEEDEKRPYKFAFAIEGYQHRSEEKDERGIIMGEFGFVTGDGVYHVTVYATDENGDFKILKMKNYYIGLPGEGTTAAPTRAPTVPPTTPPPSTPSTTKSSITKHIEGLMGCSGCIIPDKKNGAGGRPSSDGDGLLDIRFGNAGPPNKPSGSPGKPGIGVGKPAYNEKPSGGGLGGGNQPGKVGSPGVAGGGQPPYGPQQPPTNGQRPEVSPQYNTPSVGQGVRVPGSGGFNNNNNNNNIGQAPPLDNRFGGNPNEKPGSRPGSGGGATSGSPKPGSPQYAEGLPPGMSMQDLMALLYKFNYTLKYHGHHESGYRNGDKEGGYFFNGKDGLGRNVEYIANEFGFQPNITLVDLGLQHPDTPKAENEEPNELRGNEFKWFYNR